MKKDPRREAEELMAIAEDIDPGIAESERQRMIWVMQLQEARKRRREKQRQLPADCQAPHNPLTSTQQQRDEGDP